MKKQLLICTLGTIMMCIAFRLSAQVAVTTDGTPPDNSAMFDVKSTTKGALLPRMTMAQRDAIGSPANSLVIYQTDGIPGYYYNSGTGASPLWLMVGNNALALPYEKHVSYEYSGFKVFNDYTVGSPSGIWGVSAGLTGRGVCGITSSQTGENYGVYGESASEYGCGVFGRATSTGLSGITYGVYGESKATHGSGVYGVANSTSGVAYGLKGESYSDDGLGVAGFATSVSGFTYGVYGNAISPYGCGVYGTNVSTAGDALGIYGESSSSAGFAIYGYANKNSGVTHAIAGQVLSPDGYSGHFRGGRFYVEGHVGIGTTNPEFPLVVMTSVAGSTDIADFRDPDNNNMVRIRQSGNGSGGVHVYNGLTPNVNTILLYGNGDSYINGGNLGIGTTAPAHELTVIGNAAKSMGGSTWLVLSDARLKNLAGNYNKGLDEIAALQPVKFFYKAGNPFDLPSDQEQIGFVAQEVQKVFPEAVHQSKDGYLDFNMHPVNVALVNAVKELKAENDRLRAENEQINARLSRIEALVSPAVIK